MADALSASPCHLLNLPSEIRIEIYRNLFDAAELSLDGGHPESIHCGSSICSCSFPWRILGTCQQLRNEATPYLLSATTLQICSTAKNIQRLPPTYVEAIPRAVILNVEAVSKKQLQLDHFPSLKTLELRNITVWCKYHEESYLESPAGDECMIGLAMFNLNRISPHLTRLCTNMQRSFKILLCCQYVASSTTDETLHAVLDIDGKVVLHKSRGPAVRDRNAWAGFY